MSNTTRLSVVFASVRDGDANDSRCLLCFGDASAKWGKPANHLAYLKGSALCLFLCAKPHLLHTLLATHKYIAQIDLPLALMASPTIAIASPSITPPQLTTPALVARQNPACNSEHCPIPLQTPGWQTATDQPGGNAAAYQWQHGSSNSLGTKLDISWKIGLLLTVPALVAALVL